MRSYHLQILDRAPSFSKKVSYGTEKSSRQVYHGMCLLKVFRIPSYSCQAIGHQG